MSYLPDILLVAGAGLVSFGAWLVYPPAGYMVGGALVLIEGILLSRAGNAS